MSRERIAIAVGVLAVTIALGGLGRHLLKTHMGAGHQGQSGRYGHLEDRAFDYTWIVDKLGVTYLFSSGL